MIGAGDFVFGSPSCEINLLYVKIMWSLNAVSNAFVLLVLVFAVNAILLPNLRNPNKMKRSTLIRKCFFFATLFVYAVSIIIVGIFRASNPRTTAIGTHPVTTIFFALGSGAFWAASLQFIYSFMMFSKSQTRFQDEDYSSNEKRLLVMMGIMAVFVILSQAVVVAMLGVTNSTQMYALGCVHYILISCIELACGLLMVPAYLGPLIKSLAESVDSTHVQNHNSTQRSKVQAVLDKIVRFRKELRNNALLHVPLAAAIGFWPFLQAQSSYWLPIAYFSSALLVLLALYIENPVRSATFGLKTGDKHPNTSGQTSSTAPFDRQQSIMVSPSMLASTMSSAPPSVQELPTSVS